jgi:hypothetical protein
MLDVMLLPTSPWFLTHSLFPVVISQWSPSFSRSLSLCRTPALVSALLSFLLPCC